MSTRGVGVPMSRASCALLGIGVGIFSQCIKSLDSSYIMSEYDGTAVDSCAVRWSNLLLFNYSVHRFSGLKGAKEPAVEGAVRPDDGAYRPPLPF